MCIYLKHICVNKNVVCYYNKCYKLLLLLFCRVILQFDTELIMSKGQVLYISCNKKFLVIENDFLIMARSISLSWSFNRLSICHKMFRRFFLQFIDWNIKCLVHIKMLIYLFWTVLFDFLFIEISHL